MQRPGGRRPLGTGFWGWIHPPTPTPVPRARVSPEPWALPGRPQGPSSVPKSPLGRGAQRSKDCWPASPLGLEDAEQEKPVGASDISVPPTIHNAHEHPGAALGGVCRGVGGAATVSESYPVLWSWGAARRDPGSLGIHSLVPQFSSASQEQTTRQKEHAEDPIIHENINPFCPRQRGPISLAFVVWQENLLTQLSPHLNVGQRSTCHVSMQVLG